jgi:hypothetical protein
MTRRYVTMWSPVGEWTSEPNGIATMDVFEAERAPQPTGLLDRFGRPLMAIEDRPPMGFLKVGGAS